MEQININPILKRIQEKQKRAHLRYLQKVKNLRNGKIHQSNRKSGRANGNTVPSKTWMGFGTQTTLLSQQVQSCRQADFVNNGRGFQGNPHFRQKK